MIAAPPPPPLVRLWTNDLYAGTRGGVQCIPLLAGGRGRVRVSIPRLHETRVVRVAPPFVVAKLPLPRYVAPGL